MPGVRNGFSRSKRRQRTDRTALSACSTANRKNQPAMSRQTGPRSRGATVSTAAVARSKRSGGFNPFAWGVPENDRPYPRLPARPTTRRPLPRRRPRRRARQLPRLRPGAARQPRLLRGQGQSGAGGAEAPRRASARPSTAPASPEIDMALAAGATPDRISYGNTIKKERDIAAAYRARHPPLRGRLPSRRSTRSRAPRPAPASSAASSATATAPSGRCRGSSAARRRWPSTCSSTPIASASTPTASPSMSARSSRTRRPGTSALKATAAIFRTLSERGIQLRMVNLGGGFPAKYLKKVPAVKTYGRAILDGAPQAFRQPHPGDDHRARPRHGRRRRRDQGRGRAHLEEGGRRRAALGLSRHRQVRRPRRDDGRGDPLPDPHRRTTATRTAPCVIAGPTCDSADVLYEKTPYELPVSLSIGDEVLIEGTGAYTHDLLGGRLQRLRAAQVLRDLSARLRRRVGARREAASPATGDATSHRHPGESRGPSTDVACATWAVAVTGCRRNHDGASALAGASDSRAIPRITEDLRQ